MNISIVSMKPSDTEEQEKRSLIVSGDQEDYDIELGAVEPTFFPECRMAPSVDPPPEDEDDEDLEEELADDIEPTFSPAYDIGRTVSPSGTDEQEKKSIIASGDQGENDDDQNTAEKEERIEQQFVLHELIDPRVFQNERYFADPPQAVYAVAPTIEPPLLHHVHQEITFPRPQEITYVPQEITFDPVPECYIERVVEPTFLPVEITFDPKYEIDHRRLNPSGSVLSLELVAYAYTDGGTVIEHVMPPLDSDEPKTEIYDAVFNRYYGKLEMLVCTDEEKYGINHKNKDGWTPLHLAAYMDDKKAVLTLRKASTIDLMPADEDGDTPLHVAMFWESMCVYSELLNQGAIKVRDPDTPISITVLEKMVNTPNKAGNTPLSYAAARFNTETCRYLIKLNQPLTIQTVDKRSAEILKFDIDNHPVVHLHDRTKGQSSSINLMIKNLPEVVMEILDRSMKETKLQGKDQTTEIEKYRMILDFNALEEYNVNISSEDKQSSEHHGKGLNCLDSYWDGNKPLQVMVKNHRFELLTHPLVEALISRKWQGFARAYFYFVTVLFYVIFLGALMTYELSQIQPVGAWLANSTHSCSDYPGSGCVTGKSSHCIVAGAILLGLAICRLILELVDVTYETFVKIDADSGEQSGSQYYKGFVRYISIPRNGIEVVLYSTAVAFSSNILSDEIMSPLLWQIGTVCVFFAYTNLLMISRVFPLVGLHIIMFMRIFRTFLTKIAVLLVFFILVKLIFNNPYLYCNSKI